MNESHDENKDKGEIMEKLQKLAESLESVYHKDVLSEILKCFCVSFMDKAKADTLCAQSGEALIEQIGGLSKPELHQLIFVVSVMPRKAKHDLFAMFKMSTDEFPTVCLKTGLDNFVQAFAQPTSKAVLKALGKIGMRIESKRRVCVLTSTVLAMDPSIVRQHMDEFEWTSAWHTFLNVMFATQGTQIALKILESNKGPTLVSEPARDKMFFGMCEYMAIKLARTYDAVTGALIQDYISVVRMTKEEKEKGPPNVCLEQINEKPNKDGSKETE